MTELLSLFDKYGEVMFAQQRVIYRHLSREVAECDVLEVGCGTGQGTAILSQTAERIVGTDKSERSIDFARKIYPWLNFWAWDAQEDPEFWASTVVCVEVIEHIEKARSVVSTLSEIATKVLWLSTPNGRLPNDNPDHVKEFTPEEMVEMLGDHTVIRNWETWEMLSTDTCVTPLVYEVRR